MIKKIKSKFQSEDNKRLLSNFLSLSVLQGANYILPLITLPYLVRVLGVEYFGLLAFAGAIIAYFKIITDYGFNLTATREISIHRDNKEKVIEIFSSVMTIKVMLMCLSFLLLFILVFSVEKFRADALVYFLTFGTVVGQVLFPIWFFQGMEQMKYITYLNILSKTIFTVAIFIFVQEQTDFYIVPLLTSIGFIIAGVWSLIIIKKDFDIDFKLQKKSVIQEHLKNGWFVFLSQLKISLFSSTNIIILGFFTNNTAVGYYSAAEKVMRALAMMQGPVVGVLFPYMSKLIIDDKEKAVRLLKKVLLIGSLLYTIILTVVFIFAEKIIVLLFGNSAGESIILLQIMSIIPLAIFLNNIFGTQILLNIHKEKYFFIVLLTGGLINLILCGVLTSVYGAVGTTISLLIVEVYIMFGMLYYAKDFLHARKH